MVFPFFSSFLCSLPIIPLYHISSVFTENFAQARVVVGLPGRPVAGIVIDVHVGLVQVRVILPRQLSQLIVGIPDGPGGRRILVSDSGDVPDGVIDIGVPGGGVTYNRFTGTDQAGGASGADLLVLITHRLGEACIFIRRGGFLRQAVHAVVPVDMVAPWCRPPPKISSSVSAPTPLPSLPEALLSYVYP